MPPHRPHERPSEAHPLDEPQDGSGRRAWLRRLLVIPVLGYLGWCILLFFMQDRLIFPTQMAGPGVGGPPAGARIERIWLEMDDGVKVEAWYAPAHGASAETPHPAIVVFHGNGDLIDFLMDYADFFNAAGLSVLLVEYRGYGRSGGPATVDSPRARPSQRAIVADALRFVRWLESRPEVDRDRLVYLGRSLGTGVAAQVAALRRPAAVVLESPFLSIASFARGMGVPPWLVRHPFRTDLALPPLAAAGLPVLIVHTRDDEIVPFSHAEALVRLMPSARLVELTGSHNAALLTQGAYEQAVLEFLEHAGIVSGQ